MELLDFLINTGLDLSSVKNKHFTNDYDIYIGRPSKWGNPIFLKDRTSEIERIKVLIKYCEYLREDETLLNSTIQLKDKTLGCYCSPSLCHGFILNIVSKTENKRQTINYIINGLSLYLKREQDMKINIRKIINSQINIEGDKVEGNIIIGDKVEGKIYTDDKPMRNKNFTITDFKPIRKNFERMDGRKQSIFSSVFLEDKDRNKVLKKLKKELYRFLGTQFNGSNISAKEIIIDLISSNIDMVKKDNEKFLKKNRSANSVYQYPRFLFIAFNKADVASQVCDIINPTFDYLDATFSNFLKLFDQEEVDEEYFINFMAAQTFKEAAYQNPLDVMMVYKFEDDEDQLTEDNFIDGFRTQPVLINIMMDYHTVSQLINEGELK